MITAFMAKDMAIQANNTETNIARCRAFLQHYEQEIVKAASDGQFHLDLSWAWKPEWLSGDFFCDGFLIRYFGTACGYYLTISWYPTV